jgi:hypothetical protein
MKHCARDETGLFLLGPHNTDFGQQLRHSRTRLTTDKPITAIL